MWCANCRADVAAAVSADKRRILCATCNAELEQPSTSSSHPATRDAEEILARWSNSGMFDPFGPLSSVTRRDGHREPETIPRTDEVEETHNSDMPQVPDVAELVDGIEDDSPEGESFAVPAVASNAADNASDDAPDSDDTASALAAPETPSPTVPATRESSSIMEEAGESSAEGNESSETDRGDLDSEAAVARTASGKFRLDGPHRRKPLSQTDTDRPEPTVEPPATTADLDTGFDHASDHASHHESVLADTLDGLSTGSTETDASDAAASPQEPAATATDAPPSSQDTAPSADSRAEQDRPAEQHGGSRPAAFTRRHKEPHSPTARGPHFNVREEVRLRQMQQTNWVGIVSQFLSYCGVAGLTIGTVCVIWGYFGGIPSYLPVGWLVLTFGQMLLFLGMITLVSSGIENSSAELTRQLDGLRDRLNEIERNRDSEPRANAA